LLLLFMNLASLIIVSRISVVATVFWNLSSSIALAFPDTQTHWANACITQLSDQRLVTGYPDNSFKPQATVTRAEFAVLMLNAFPGIIPTRRAMTFRDVPATHWAARAISEAHARQFFSGYPDGTFQPSQPIPRVQAIAILANAANLSSSEAADTVLQRYFDDAQQVPNYARRSIAAGTVGRLAVNYPNVRQLRPNQSATRGEVAAFLCQALNLPRTVPLAYIADRDRFVIPPELGGTSRIGEGLLNINLNGKVGYMDMQGTIVISPQFDEALPFSEGLAAVRSGEKWGFINRSGAFVISPQFNLVLEGFADGLARVYFSDYQVRFIDKSGNVVIQPQSNEVTPFSEGLAGIKINDQWGYMDKTGAIVIQPQFQAAKTFSQGLAPIRLQYYWGYIDRTGRIVIEPQFHDAEPFSDGLAAIATQVADAPDRWGYINQTGNVVIPAQFYAPTEDFRGRVVIPFSQGVAMARRGEQVGFLDRTGNWTLAPQVADFDIILNGLARVNVGGTWVREEIGCTQATGCDYATNLRGGKLGYIRVP
jgi:hypothetical protein